MGRAIKVSGLGKRYQLGEFGTKTLGGDLERLKARIMGKEDPYSIIGAPETEKSHFWALKDLNFEIGQGDICGIIGKNGAGKSTLLKILSRVTTPTKGRIEINGRLASLLEVGTGFHPEMTGRENIYMNGVILGMSKREITQQLDAIIDFSGVENYIDTPVKRYSSGMYVRLGFAVAAHLSPDILVVDEVLAVGDAEFQRKAIGKMKDVSTNQGRTVLFVSHNMVSVRSLCTTGILLEKGDVISEGKIENVLANYIGGEISEKSRKKSINDDFGFLLLEKIELKNSNKGVWDENSELTLEISGLNRNVEKGLRFNLVLSDGEDNPLFAFSSLQGGIEFSNHKSFVAECHFPKSFFNVGRFALDLFVLKEEQTLVKHYTRVLEFEIIYGKRMIGSWSGKEPGAIKPNFLWELHF